METNNSKTKEHKLLLKKVFFTIFFIKLKEKYIQENVLLIRKVSIIKIVNSMRELFRRNQEKKQIFIFKLIRERLFFTKYIQKKYKSFKFQKDVRKLIDRSIDNFSIICGMKNANKIYLNVFFKDNTTKKFDFEYCKIRKVFVLYILRSRAAGSVFKVHFVCDDKVVIDPQFRTSYDEKGNFYNLIDFNKIEKQERMLSEDKERIIKYFMSILRREKELEEAYFKINGEDKEESSSDSEVDEPENNKSRNLKILKQENNKFVRNNNNHRKSVDFTTDFKSKSFFILNKPLGRNSTYMNLLSPKSILRSPNSKGNLGAKKVSFSNKVEFNF